MRHVDFNDNDPRDHGTRRDRLYPPAPEGHSDAKAVTLTRAEQSPRGQRATCAVRFPSYPMGYPSGAPQGWGWCPEIGRWVRVSQLLCDFHAGMVCAGILPIGISVDGKWANEPVEEAVPAE